MSNTITGIIKTIYGRKYNLDEDVYDLGYKYDSYELVSSRRHFMTKLDAAGVVIRNKWIQIISTLIILFLSYGSVFYFNRLVEAEQNVLTARGKVEALLQRRNDISINLSKAVLDYSKHERGVFTAIVALRSMMTDEAADNAGFKDVLNKFGQSKGAASAASIPSAASGKTSLVPGASKAPSNAGTLKVRPDSAIPPVVEMLPAASGKASILPGASRTTAGAGTLKARPDIAMNPAGDMLSPLAGLFAVAEQYPDLKLSGNFQNLMNALVEVEKDLAVQRLKYNDSVNMYTTAVAKFPSNVFASIYGFKEKPYFEANAEAKKLIPIAY